MFRLRVGFQRLCSAGAMLALCLMVAVPAFAANDDEATATSEERQAMNSIAEVAMQTAMKAIQESGGLYPFAMIAKADGDAKVLGYQGTQETAPPPDQWTAALFMRLQQMAEEEPDLKVLVLVRLHEVTSKQGEKVPGIWAQVDHRDAEPWVLFLPFLRNEAGRHEVGELIYYASEQPIFP
ncbi:hypothetical protein K8B33_11530 [Alcanivorax sp. JB21]|uniref:hypothetical protein n=1 Tax=Alcanivorax limicola TaxID=2874102 RepID=UPI001CBA985B|nr:hypothetical protein [Alcanivorax limicola]MBZ2189732.1 hypothetical protein [Alcanivorax limicola]